MLLPDISYLSSIYFKPGAAGLLPELLQQNNLKKPLIATDKGIVALGMVDKLGCKDAVIFDEIFSNPDEDSVLKGVELFKENNCDCIVALGGGSPIDCAKIISVAVGHELPIEQYAFLNGGLPKITSKKPPVFAIPTTAGTGSEVGRAALVTLNNGRKMAFLSPHLIPTAVMCDPSLTLGTPPALTAGAGLDAISHCVETFCSPKFNPPAEAIALDGLKRACTNLPIAVKDGQNLEARSELMMAALEGGMTFQKGLGIIHSLSHPLGALKDVRLHHGTLNGVFLSHSLKFNMESCPEKMERMSQTLGLKSSAELPGYFDELMEKVGAPATLSGMGCPQLEFEPYAKYAEQDHCSLTNPRKVTADDCLKIYEAAY